MTAKLKVTEKIQQIRRFRRFSQEAMVAQLGISTNSYAKLARGETQLTLNRLEQIADIFDMDILELLQTENNIVCLINENSQNSSNYYSCSEECTVELEKYRVQITLMEKLLEQKDKEISALNKLVEIHESKSSIKS